MAENSIATNQTSNQLSSSITVTLRREGARMPCRVESLAYFTVCLFRAHAALEHHKPVRVNGVWTWEIEHLPADVYGYAQSSERDGMIAVFGAFPLVGAVAEVARC